MGAFVLTESAARAAGAPAAAIMREMDFLLGTRLAVALGGDTAVVGPADELLGGPRHFALERGNVGAYNVAVEKPQISIAELARRIVEWTKSLYLGR